MTAPAEPRLAPDIAAMLLQTGEERRSAIDSMMWQVPVLSLTAQSFLLTIALGADTSRTGRGIASLLALFAAVAAIQLLLKHRFHEEQLSHWLERLSREQNWPQLYHPGEAESFAYHGRSHSWKDGRHTGTSVATRLRWRLAQPSSVYVWVTTLAGFALADLLVFVSVATSADFLS